MIKKSGKSGSAQKAARTGGLKSPKTTTANKTGCFSVAGIGGIRPKRTATVAGSSAKRAPKISKPKTGPK